MRKPKKADIASEAYRLLSIEEIDVLGVAKITPILQKANVLPKVWDYLSMSSEETARKLVAMKDRLSTKAQVNSVPFEAFCVAAGVETKKALALITAEVYSATEQSALLMASAAHPDIVKATIAAAKHPTGGRERDMLLKHSGFVPVPKTSVVHVHGGRNQIGEQQNTQNVLAVLPPIESVVRSMSDRFNDKLAIAAVSQEAVIEGDFEELPDGDDEDDND